MKKTTKKKPKKVYGVEVKGDVNALRSLSLKPPPNLEQLVGSAQADLSAALKRLDAAMQKLNVVKKEVEAEDRSGDAFPD